MNMKQFNQKLALSILILSSLTLAACGGGGSGGGDSGDGDDGGDGGGKTNQEPVANAGPDLQVSRNFTVNLDASGSSDADGDALTYSWTQIAGPAVDGTPLSGATPAFVAPSEVGTIIFELVVNDGTENSPADTVMINVLEDVNVTYFVDGDNGSDVDGSGSMDNPFASIGKALCEVTADQQDIYVMTRAGGASYDETSDPCPGDPARSAEQILAVPTGTSVYGGYDDNWVRKHTTTQTPVMTLHHGFRFSAVDLNAWFSGLNVQAGDSPGPGDSAYAVYAIGGTANLTVSDNSLIAGDVGFGTAASPGSSFGLVLSTLESANVSRSMISAGLAGDGLDVGNIFSTEASSGSNGGNANGTSPGGGGDGKGPSDYDGGGGGAPGTAGGENGSKGGNGEGPAGLGGCGGGQSSGGFDCIGDSGGGNVGRRGQNGGFGGNGVSGSGGPGNRIVPFKGNNGSAGGDGGGAGGGGGGEANAGVNGGAGGGGGGGGRGGAGGPGGPDGGVSIGLYITAVNTSLIEDNIIFGGRGGSGATGGQGQVGGDGGAAGAGGDGNSGAFGITGGDGGNGGSGGKGGTGGRGGAGGGGPSYGIAVGSNISPSITNNDIASGDGGFGGFGGNGGNGGTGGYSYAVYDNDINDGMVPALSNNTLNFGLPGDGGNTTGSGGSIGSAGESGVTNW